jgi:threonylcarbamoyladenosine tRNA methylthiotransferase CDKAL1
MDHPKVRKFLHRPIQTGSPRILAAMNRGNTLDEFWAVVDAFRERFPAPGSVVSTDIIVAFPGETEEDHRASYDLLDRLDAEHVNITRFSARPGTPAKTMPDRVPTSVAKRRSTELTHLVWSKWDAQNPARIGDTFELHALEAGKKPGTVLCRGPAYEPVVVRDPDGSIPLGSRFTARIVDARTTYFIAEPIGAVTPNPKAGRNETRRLPVLPVVP